MCERCADVNVVNRVAHGGGGVMVWAGICYGQRTQVHFIDRIENAHEIPWRDREAHVLHCVRQMLVTPDTDWSPPSPHICEIHSSVPNKCLFSR